MKNKYEEGFNRMVEKSIRYLDSQSHVRFHYEPLYLQTKFFRILLTLRLLPTVVKRIRCLCNVVIKIAECLDTWIGAFLYNATVASQACRTSQLEWLMLKVRTFANPN